MIGIYKYTNLINGKIYIGLSNDIQRRRHEHQNLANSGDDAAIHKAIRKYGIENFSFEILETFDREDRELLGEREKYWISYYNSYENGYNNTTGGDITQGRSKLTEQDVIDIRTRYKNLERCMIVYQDYKDRINKTGFNKVWKGETWKSIMPEIYTPERIAYHKTHTGNSGSYNGRAKISDDDVRNIRLRVRDNEPIIQIYEDYKEKLTYRSFYNIARGYNWKHIKI